jgi:choloylglycine hydrolase
MRSVLLRRASALVAVTAALCTSLAEPGSACTRTLYVGDDGLVLTGRNMD